MGAIMTRSGGTWDVIIIGAGPAGSVSACLAARAGLRTLLVDRAPFPRQKVCGGCLADAGIDILRHIGLGDILDRIDAPAYRGLSLHAGRVTARFNSPAAPSGRIVLRDHFDEALRERAVDLGADFLIASALSTNLDDDHRTVTVRIGQRRTQALEAKVIVASSGLGGTWLQSEPTLRERINPRARVGIGAVVDSPGRTPEPGHIEMHIGQGGYVGIAQAGASTIIGAAIEPGALRTHTPVQVVERILRRSVPATRWRGAPALTRRRGIVSAPRLFLAGDACGYVEPITGEGMTWAIASAASLAPLIRARAGGELGTERRWNELHARVVASRRATCHAARLALSSTFLTFGAARALGASSLARRTVARRLTRIYAVPA
jgi:flavin-dependent dehydrogenase